MAGFFLAAVLPAATWPLIDGDVWWHLRAGTEVLDIGSVPRTDAWSILGYGRPWISQDWLANIAMAWVRGIGSLGETALSLTFGFGVVASFALLWWAVEIRRPAASWASRLVWLSLGLVVAAPVLGVRVQVLDLVLSAVVMVLLSRYLTDGRRRWLSALPLVAAAWANLHAGWPLLFALGGAYLAGEAVERLWRRPIRPDPLTWAQLRDLGLALLVAFAALAVNPNGTALWTYPLDTLGNAVLGRYIVEWFPVTADPRLLRVYLALVLLAAIPTLVLGRRSLRVADALVIIGLSLMAAYAVRFLLVAGPLVATLAAVHLAPRLADRTPIRRFQPTIARMGAPHGGGRGTTHLILTAVVVVLGVALSAAKVTPSAQLAAAAASFPVLAVAWLDGHEPGDRIFNQYEWGGYLGLQRPHRLIFVDGRADVYGQNLLAEYAALISVRVDPQTELDRYEIDHVIFPPDSPLGRWLDASSGWERAYADALAVVWVRR